MSLYDVDNEAEAVARIVKKRVSFIGHLVTWTATSFFLLVTAGFEPAMVVAAGWGIGLALHAWTVYGQRPITEDDIREEMRRNRSQGP